MKIAGIAITYNDGYKLNEWCHWYDEYKDDLGLYIIVDNGSASEYIDKLESSFPNAIIIKRTSNGGCTSAYNDGIRRALDDPEVTHIALIGNDIRLAPGALSKCVELLDSDKDLGMVAPILLYANSNIVADFGCSISKDLSMNPYGVKLDRGVLSPNVRYCDAVTGGMNVAKRSFYETLVGLQDEKLFMYSDEVDMALRAKRSGVKMAVIKDALSWHQHINPLGNNRRHPFSSYLIARNKVYLGKKHFGYSKQLSIFGHYFMFGLFSFLKDLSFMQWNRLIYSRWLLWGALNGLIGNMKDNKYSKM